MNDAGIEVRRVRPTDVDAIVRMSTGPIAGKRRFIVESVVRRDVFVASLGDRPVGYIIWDRAFFGRPFVWLVGVEPAFRRRGVAARLMSAFDANCGGEPRFTSTNESNVGMQALLIRLGFIPSGRVDNIDPGDPELFYFKSAQPMLTDEPS